MKKKLNILLILISVGVVVFVGLTFFGISIMRTKTENEYFEKQKQNYTELTQKRILYSYGLDTLNWENYVLKRKINLTLKKIERDSTIFFALSSSLDSTDTYGSIQYVKIDSSLYIYGEKYHIIEAEKYFNKNLSKFQFDLYELIESYDDANGPFLFNTDYGILNVEAWSAGRQIFYLPNESTVDIEKELLRNLKSE
ncbi:hypothetical protein [Dokdonia sp. Asnod1-B02]|uniref:hypothetical protein n=1 Tax=Dokdonia sp. Asnod1-B02 TaxID=3160573 RepID=UPI00386793E3